MASLESAAFIRVNGSVINVANLFGTLQLFGQFQPLIRNYLQDFVLQQEFQIREELVVTSSELSQRIIDFRIDNTLNDSEAFEQWLSSQGIDYSVFEQQALFQLKLEKLKDSVSALEIQSRYNQTPNLWDKVDLVYLTMSDEGLATQIRAKLDNGDTFESVYQEFASDAEPQKVIFRRDLLRRNKIKPEIKAVVDTATGHDILGPIQMGEYWCLCNVQKIIPSTLDAQVKQELREQVFMHWMEDKLKQLDIAAPEELPQAESRIESSQENYAESSV